MRKVLMVLAVCLACVASWAGTMGYRVGLPAVAPLTPGLAQVRFAPVLRYDAVWRSGESVTLVTTGDALATFDLKGWPVVVAPVFGSRAVDGAPVVGLFVGSERSIPLVGSLEWRVRAGAYGWQAQGGPVTGSLGVSLGLGYRF